MTYSDPSRTMSPVGWGAPPAGSMETATAPTRGAVPGATKVRASPVPSSSPALTGVLLSGGITQS